MSFNSKLPNTIKNVRKQIRDTEYAQDKIREEYHECNCEHCEVGNNLSWEEIEEQEQELHDVLNQLKKLLKLLKLYAKDRGIKLPEEDE